LRLSKQLAVWVVVILFFSTISIGLVSGYEDDMDTESGPLEDILSDALLEDVKSKEDDETVEVVIRIEPYRSDRDPSKPSLDEMDTEQTIQSLKTHSERTQARLLDSIEREDGEVLNTFWIANAVLAEVEVESLEVISEYSEVTRIHENFEVETLNSEGTSEDAMSEDERGLESEIGGDTRGDLYSNSDLTWGLERINVEGLWDQGIDGSDIRVAVSDTGVDIEHPDLEGKMVNLEDDEYCTGGWIEFNRTGHIVENSTPRDTTSHGTHVSGTIAGENASGTHIGVAPEVDLMHALIIPGGYGRFAAALAGLEWKVEPHDRFGNTLEPVEEHRPHVASMSWGPDGYHQEYEEPMINLKDAGIVPVASMGNSGNGTVGVPGAVYRTLGIGASNVTDGIAEFSSGGIVEDERNETPEEFVKPDLAAPGVEVKSALSGGGWQRWQGTSMSTPHVAGTVALMLDVKENLSLEDIYHDLRVTADHYEAGGSLPGEDKNTRYGHGIIDAHKAVNAAVGNLVLEEPENISRFEATLKGEVIEVPNDEMEVFFRYRQESEEQWSETEPITLTEPDGFETDIDGLEKGTVYEYKAVEVRDDENETTFSRTFTSHDDIEVKTLEPENVSEKNPLLRGEITDIYVEEGSAFFRYRRDSDDEWNETEPQSMDGAGVFEEEIDDIAEISYCEFKAVASTEEREFTGEILTFETRVFRGIQDWHDLDEIREHLDGYYYLEDDLDEDTSGYDEYNSQTEDYEAEEDAGRYETWDEGDTIDIPFDEDASDSVLSVKNNTGETIPYTVDYPTITIDEDTGERFVYVTYENAVVGWNPIGNTAAPFTGDFDGNGYETEDLYIDRPATDRVGLFGLLGREAEITGLNLVEMDLRGNDMVGGVTGHNRGVVNNSSTTGEVIGEDNIGGLVGYNDRAGFEFQGKINHSHADSYVMGTDQVGGLVGESEWGTLKNSSSNGKVEGNNDVGGFLGWSIGDTIENIHSDSDVIGNEKVGGLIGRNGFGFLAPTDLHDSYATGEVRGNHSVGGVLGLNDHRVSGLHAEGNVIGGNFTGGLVGRGGTYAPLIEDSFAKNNISGTNYVGGLIGGGEHMNVLENSSASGQVDGEHGVGGLVGGNTDGYIDIYHSYSSVNVSGDTEVGGLAGSTVDRSEVENSYSVSEVEGVNKTGGLVGRNNGTISDSYAAGSVSGYIDVGGLVGYDEGTVENSFYHEDMPECYVEGFGSLSLNDEEFGSISTFESAGWDIEMIETDRDKPFLSWEDGDADSTWYIKETEQTHDLTIDIEGEGDTDPTEGTHTYYEHGKIVIEAIPDEGWYFEGWSGDYEDTEEKITVTMDEDKEITAHFEEDVTLTIEDITGQGTIEVDDEVIETPFEKDYKQGIEADLSADPYDGWYFGGWTGDVESDEEEINVTMDSDKNVTANFERVMHELSVDVEGEGTIEILHEGEIVEVVEDEWTGEFQKGTYITLNAEADDDWNFGEWSGDASGEEEKEVSVTMDEDIEITAVFEEEEDETPGFLLGGLFTAIIASMMIYKTKKDMRS